jgi:hypothetical protein
MTAAGTVPIRLLSAQSQDGKRWLLRGSWIHIAVPNDRMSGLYSLITLSHLIATQEAKFKLLPTTALAPSTYSLVWVHEILKERISSTFISSMPRLGECHIYVQTSLIYAASNAPTRIRKVAWWISMNDVQKGLPIQQGFSMTAKEVLGHALWRAL